MVFDFFKIQNLVKTLQLGKIFQVYIGRQMKKLNKSLNLEILFKFLST